MITETAVEQPQINDLGYSLDGAVLRDDSTLETGELWLNPSCGSDLTGLQGLNQPYTFEYYNSSDMIINLHDTFFTAKVKFQAADGNAWIQNADVSPSSNIGLLFFRATLSLGDKIIEDIDNFGECSHVSSLVFSSNEYMTRQGANEGVYKNTGAGDITDPAIVAMKARTVGDVSAAVAPKYSYFKIKPCFGMITDNMKYLRPETKLSITFYRGDDRKVFVKAAGYNTAAKTPIFILKNLQMCLPYKKPTASLMLQINEKLANSVVRYEYSTLRSRKVVIKAGSTDIPNMLGNFSARPAAVLMYFRQAGRYADSRAITDAWLNPLSFDILPLQRIQLLVNGVPTPSVRYEFEALDNDKLALGNYVRVYDELMKLGGKDNYVVGTNITYEEWAKYYPIFVFNLQNNKNISLPELNRTPTRIECQAQFPAQAADYECHFIFLFHNVVSVAPKGIANIEYGAQ